MEKIVAPRQTNRRASQRRPPRGTVHVECRKGSFGLGRNIVSTALDVSDTGARLIVKESLEILAEVEIVITGYGMKKPLKRAAYVRWQVKLDDGRFCVGAEFQKRLPYREWLGLATPG